MKQCIRCGKSGLFLKLDKRGLCEDCAKAFDAAVAAVAAERQAKIDKAAAFIREYGSHVGKVVHQRVLLPKEGPKKLAQIMQECDYVLEHINDWKNYDCFHEAFDQLLQKHSPNIGTSPLYPGRRIALFNNGYIDKLFDEISRKTKETRSKAFSAKLKAYDYTKEFKVVGVTFKNGRRSRQTILRAIHFEDPPYNGTIRIKLNKELYEGDDAVSVFTNDEQVGYISKDDLPWLLGHWNEFSRVIEYSVYGGGDKSYGLRIIAAFVEKS